MHAHLLRHVHGPDEAELRPSTNGVPDCKQPWREELDELLYDHARKNRIPFRRPPQVRTERQRPKLSTRPAVPMLCMLCCPRDDVDGDPKDPDTRMIWAPNWNAISGTWSGCWGCLACGRSIQASNPVVRVLLEEAAQISATSVLC